MKFFFGVLCSSMLITQIIYASVNEQHVKVGYEHKSYNQDRGNLNLGFVEYKLKRSNATLLGKISTADRDYGSDISYKGTKGDLDLYYKWNDILTTKTGVSFSDNTPAFLHQEYRQDFNISPIKNINFNFGGKHTKYENDINVNSYSLGLSYYFDRAMVSYKYNNHYSSEKGNSHGNIVSAKLKDKEGAGTTQIWFGFGTGAYQYDWEPSNMAMTGDYKGVSLRREQPINQNWIIGATLSKSWYEPPMMEKYSYTGGVLDLTYKW